MTHIKRIVKYQVNQRGTRRLECVKVMKMLRRMQVQWCIRRCSRLVNEDTRCEPWQGCHYKDEPPLNAPPKHANLRALYPISRTLSHTIFTLSPARCLYAHLTLICQFIAATHLNFFFTFWYSMGCFWPRNICLILCSKYILKLKNQLVWSDFNIEKQEQTMGGGEGLWTNWAFPFCMQRERRGNACSVKSPAVNIDNWKLGPDQPLPTATHQPALCPPFLPK